jgi:hypothetical protein
MAATEMAAAAIVRDGWADGPANAAAAAEWAKAAKLARAALASAGGDPHNIDTAPPYFSTGFSMANVTVESIKTQLRVAPYSYDRAISLRADFGGDSGDAAAHVKAIQKDLLLSARDNMWIVQEHLGQYSESKTAMRSVIRIEVIGGVVQTDYIVKVTAPAFDFGLCPCDPRSAEIAARTSFVAINNPLTIPGFRPRDFNGEVPEGEQQAAAKKAFDTFCRKIEDAFKMAGSLIGSVEGIPLWGSNAKADMHPTFAARWSNSHEPVIFDFNTCNSNYNAAAEEVGGMEPGVSRVARFLEGALRAGTSSSAG